MTIHVPFAFKTGIVLVVGALMLVGYRGWQLANADWVGGRVQQLVARNERCGTKQRRPCTRFAATVSYEVGGRPYWLEEPAGSASEHNRPVTLASLRIGDTVEVAYDPAEPGDHYNGGWHVTPMIAVVAGIGGIALVFLGLKKPREFDPNSVGYDAREQAPVSLNLSGSTPTPLADGNERRRSDLHSRPTSLFDSTRS
jgi:hypothetical protein